MTQTNLVTVFVVVASAVIPYLISQQDVVIAPVWKVVLTAANIGLIAFARLSNPNQEPVKVQLEEPVSVTGTKP